MLVIAFSKGTLAFNFCLAYTTKIPSVLPIYSSRLNAIIASCKRLLTIFTTSLENLKICARLLQFSRLFSKLGSSCVWDLVESSLKTGRYSCKPEVCRDAVYNLRLAAKISQSVNRNIIT